MRKTVAAWMVVLLGVIAAAAMVPQFAIFIPIVTIAWILARFGLLPRFVHHRHPTVRLALGDDAPLTWLAVTIEADPGHEADEKAVLERLVASIDAHAGARAGADAGLIAWGEGAPTEAPAPGDWPELGGPLRSGARAALASRSEAAGRCVRLSACLAGARELVEPASLRAAAEMRAAGIEVVTTGRLRHEERLRTGGKR